MGALRKVWQDAKKISEANFAKAYDAFLSDLEKQAKGGDPKARQKILNENLKKAGFVDGPKYTSYMSFGEDFGPNLDKIETMAESLRKAEGQIDGLKMPVILKHKEVAPIVQHAFEKHAHVPENYHFLATGFKLAPPAMYATYIREGGKYQLNLPGSMRTVWDECSQTGNWGPAKAMIPKIVSTVLGLCDQSLAVTFKHTTYRRLIRLALAGVKQDAFKTQVEKVRKVAMVYARDVQGYGKRWKALKPDFCTPLNKALNEILGEVDKMVETYL